MCCAHEANCMWDVTTYKFTSHKVNTTIKAPSGNGDLRLRHLGFWVFHPDLSSKIYTYRFVTLIESRDMSTSIKDVHAAIKVLFAALLSTAFVRIASAPLLQSQSFAKTRDNKNKKLWVKLTQGKPRYQVHCTTYYWKGDPPASSQPCPFLWLDHLSFLKVVHPAY